MASNWSASLVQAVLFEGQPSAKPDALAPWLALFGEPPTAFNRAGPAAPPSSTANGLVGEFQVGLQHSPGRLEVALLPAPKDDSDPALIPNVEDAVTVVANYLTVLLKDRPAVRLAIILNLRQVAATEIEAREIARRFMPPVELPPEAIEVQFALNVRSHLPVDPVVEINRLCRWASLRMQMLQMQIDGAGGFVHLPVSEKNFAVYDIDVNTFSQPISFSADHADQIIKALAVEALGLMVEGHERLRRDA